MTTIGPQNTTIINAAARFKGAVQPSLQTAAQPQAATPLFGARKPISFDAADKFEATTLRKYTLFPGFDISGTIRPTKITTGPEGITIKNSGWLGMTTESYTLAYTDFDLITLQTNPLFARLKLRAVSGPFKGQDIVLSHLTKADAQKIKDIGDKYSNSIEQSRLWIQHDGDDTTGNQ
jgi:hypothetical protein